MAAGKVEHFRLALAVEPRREKLAAIRLAQQRRHDVAARVEVGGHQHQLAKPGLANAVTQHFRVAPSNRRPLRPGARNQLGDRAEKHLEHGAHVQRSANRPPPPRAFSATLRWSTPFRCEDANADDCDRGGNQHQGDLRHDHRQSIAAGRKKEERTPPARATTSSISHAAARSGHFHP